MIANVKIGISLGDVNGIGPELILRTFSGHRSSSNITPVLYGSEQVLQVFKDKLGLNDLAIRKIANAKEAVTGVVNLISVWEENIDINIGASNKTGGTYAFKSLQSAVDDLSKGSIHALVTAPINKENIQSKEFSFPGHTEYLAERAGIEEALMFMCSDQLKIGVVTGHIPISKVATTISKAGIEAKIRQINKSLREDFAIANPKIAVLGLNPHAGERGLIGKEDDEIIVPAIDQMNQEGILAFGPFPADGFFGSANFKNYDGILAMYHDQGLIPFKALTFGKGVNFTAGLSFVRTSPDHGTAFDIAGKNAATISSFKAALFMARDIFLNRQANK
ncbi:MAG: 4-hydroxythreonine-4-phosphate dehydrogenase [Parvicellaceae bacterium]|jgi:4-hydroxythreonine-4-phosphate dehydrogenase